MKFQRTPDERFQKLADCPFQPNYLQQDQPDQPDQCVQAILDIAGRA